MASDLGLHHRVTPPGAGSPSSPRAEIDSLAALAGRVVGAWRGILARLQPGRRPAHSLRMRDTPLHLLADIGLADRSEAVPLQSVGLRDARPDGVLFRSHSLRH